MGVHLHDIDNNSCWSFLDVAQKLGMKFELLLYAFDCFECCLEVSRFFGFFEDSEGFLVDRYELLDCIYPAIDGLSDDFFTLLNMLDDWIMVRIKIAVDCRSGDFIPAIFVNSSAIL